MMSLIADLLLIAAVVAADANETLALEETAELNRQFDRTIARLSEQIMENPQAVNLYSQRGAAYFKRGMFKESVADFDKMIELDESLKSSHWRRGISLFYAGRFKDAARQFEIYHTFDNIDRENGIWRFLCQTRAYGIEKARQGLLKYEKTDREPFVDLYALFAGALSGDELLDRIRNADLSAAERNKRLFYAHLYLGLYAVVQNEPQRAKSHLRLAVDNPWGKGQGGGPGYMWHVGRVHYQLLKE